MKILKILGIAAGIHALALLIIFSSPGCSSSRAQSADSPPVTAAPVPDAAQPAPITSAPESPTIRYSPTRPGTAVAQALESQPVADVTPAASYAVVRGDSLWSIAHKNKLTKAELASANHLSPGATLHVGQKLIIPSKGGGAAAAEAEAATAEAAHAEKPAGEGERHVVKPGETLGGIARRYGVRQGDIAVANNITDPRKIRPGQELVIPAKSGADPKAAKTTKPKTQAPSAAPAAAAAAPADQDLDAGLKPASDADVPVVKVEDASAVQPKNP